MKKKVLLSSFLLLFVLSSTVANAHPGRTDANGGHTCRTNCAKWGLTTGEYHYHNGGSSSSSSSKKSSSSSSSSKSSTKHSSKGSSAPKSTEPTYKKSKLTVFINGEKANFNSDLIIYQNTNMVPLREISDLLGATFNYDAKSGVITVSKNSNKVTFTIGSKKVYYNGEAETINVAPMIVKGVTYVPLQSLVKGLEASLKADNSNKLSITIK
ncbi:copper amine oxidase N-terminal domain-containing protein [Paenibacillus phoenicis]|uniref:Copper amine oxidase N-terminal domain-containing protein n=2 Tax=Paenibacillus TaxID=44249 RepID=A0ABU5PPL8_9BACL|nr:copper amine oxidase N-terminal domain-containing protein [Paenibacillus phoenicis]MEA3571579.1 copper amine oxidase N-terminal domain-containing protein [Paenibacillus phoenicis]